MKKHILIFLLIIAALAPGPARVHAAAPDPQTVTAYYSYAGLGGPSTPTTGYTSVQTAILVEKFNLTEEIGDYNFIDTTITYSRVYGKLSGSGFTGYATFYWSAYEYTANDNAGDLIDYYTSSESFELNAYETATGTIELGAENTFFFGIGINGDPFRVYYETDTAYSVFQSSNYNPDPLTESNDYSNRDHSFVINVNTVVANETQTNSQLGSYYRRDIGDLFPASATSKTLTMTLPGSEYIQNITYSNGGLWDSELSTTDYTVTAINGSHNLITFSAATITSYGETYRIYTALQPYIYEFVGVYYENGTYYGPQNITVTTPNTDHTVNVSGTVETGFDYEPTLFTWTIGADGTRRYFNYNDTETIYVFQPDATYAIYECDIIDMTRLLGTGPAYLEALRSVNGTERIIERMSVQDVINNVPLNLVIGKVYRLQLRFEDGDTYDFGYFVAGSITSPKLPITSLTFSQSVQIQYSYITVEATRPINTAIVVNYEDTLNTTNLVTVSYRYRNNTEITSTSSNESTHQFNWISADQYTDYLVVVTIDHAIDTFTQTYILAPTGVYNPLPDLSDYGTFGPFSATGLLASFVTLGVMLVASSENAEIGLILGITVAGVFYSYGLATWSYELLAVIFGFIIIYGLVKPRRTL